MHHNQHTPKKDQIVASLEDSANRLLDENQEYVEGLNVSLHDKEDDKKNLNVHQEVSETQLGNIKHINTTNKMEMFNSTIMKIVVTQKKQNNASVSPR